MKKQDIIIVASLFLALLGWMLYQNRVGQERIKAAAAARAAAPPAVLTAEAAASASLTAAPVSVDGMAPVTPAPVATSTESTPVVAPIEPAPVVAVPTADPEAARMPASVATLHSDEMVVALSSRGGALSRVTLSRYSATQAEGSGPVVFDFADRPALRWEGLPGVAPDADYTLVPDGDGQGVTLTARSEQGLVVERRIVLRDLYRIEVSDQLRNVSDVVLGSSTNWIALGTLHGGSSKNDVLGVDAFDTGPKQKAKYYEREISRAISGGGGALGCIGIGGGGVVRPPSPHAVIPVDLPQQWVAVKSRFFTQVLLPGAENTGFRIEATAAPAGPKGRSAVGSVTAAVAFNGFILQPGESLERVSTLYVGPKKLAILKTIGPHVDDVMAFGTFKWVCKLLVPTLNFFYRLFHNYGVAVILLTVLVRVIFWPLTHKSTESMKRMQTLQPKLKALQAQHKDNPKKLQQETWRIYRENKVNPLSSCLPMLIQIPIFIALFTVLRSAVELRFAPFLWISDLSEPENLLAGVLPLIPALNILPILMAGTMALQSFLTPSVGDPSQQKMMMIMMPGMMLFMFYSMPAALSLYWTVSQGISILQMLLQRYRTKKRQEGGDGTMVVESPTTSTRQMRRHQAQ